MSSSYVITFIKLLHEDPVPPHDDVLVCPLFPYTLNNFFMHVYYSPSTTTFMSCESIQLFWNSDPGFLACHFHHFFHLYKHKKLFVRLLTLDAHHASHINLDKIIVKKL